MKKSSRPDFFLGCVDTATKLQYWMWIDMGTFLKLGHLKYPATITSFFA